MSVVGFKELPPTQEATARALVECLRDEAYILVPFSGPIEAFPDTAVFAFGRHLRLSSMISRFMLDTPPSELIESKMICLPLGERKETPKLAQVMLRAWENGLIPILHNRLPHGNDVEAVCDAVVSMPCGTEFAKSRELNQWKSLRAAWLKLLSSCQIDPRAALAEFMREVDEAAGALGGERVLSIRIYLLRFAAGKMEVVHPAVVALPNRGVARHMKSKLDVKSL